MAFSKSRERHRAVGGRLLANDAANPYSGVAGMPRNWWLASVGIPGWFASESLAGIRRNTHRCPQTNYSFLIEQLRGHSAHIQEVVVHCRWHALSGRKVRQLYAERRTGREVAIVEAEPGVAIVLSAWMLDPVACAVLSFGPPLVDLLSLADLHRLLKTLGLRRTCFDEPSPNSEVCHAGSVADFLALGGWGIVAAGFAISEAAGVG